MGRKQIIVDDDRQCAFCQKKLVQRWNEYRYFYIRRKYCNVRCAGHGHRRVVPDRHCALCQKSLVRRQKEQITTFAKRQFCSKRCSSNHPKRRLQRITSIAAAQEAVLGTHRSEEYKAAARTRINLRILLGEFGTPGKLSDEEIRAVCVDKRLYREIGEQYDITASMVQRIKHGLAYDHVYCEEVFIRPRASFQKGHQMGNLSDDDIRAICADARYYKEISAQYGVSVPTVWGIKHRYIYAHVVVEKLILSPKDHNHRAVNTPDGPFPTCASAARHHEISNTSACRWVKTEKNGWSYAPDLQ